jgi:hypothetical protein
MQLFKVTRRTYNPVNPASDAFASLTANNILPINPDKCVAILALVFMNETDDMLQALIFS